MGEQTYTEDEFKQVLKNLFAEKKRVRQLQRKFQAKLSTAHVSDHYSKFKEAYAAKEKECAILYERLSKVKPVIKKLLTQNETASQLEEKLQKEATRFESEKTKLVEKLAESVSQSHRQTDVIKDLHAEINNLRHEASGLKERLGNALRELEEKQELEKELYLAQEARTKVEENQSILEERLKQMQEQLLESDVETVREKFLEQVRTLKTSLEDVERIKERLVLDNKELSEEQEVLKKQLKVKIEAEQGWNQEKAKMQNNLQSSRLQFEESEGEIRQAQQHLAKKVKESTLLRDLTERQKVQLSEQEEILQKQKMEIERLQNQFNLQKRHEEKLEQMVDEWQKKSRDLQDQMQQLRDEIIDLQKVKKQYDQISNKFSDLKSCFGKES